MATGSGSSSSFASLVADLSTQVKSLASEVHLAELQSAVRKQDRAAVSHWAKLCADRHSTIDRRSDSHAFSGIFALTAPPVWLAVYKGDIACARSLLAHRADPNAVAVACPGKSECSIGGMSALHLATSRGSPECVQMLCEAGAASEAPMCFAVAEEDEPEWDEATDEFGDGLAGLSALQLAAHRSDEALCALLLEHGADGAALSRRQLTGGGAAGAGGDALPASLRPVVGDDGEVAECPICLQEVLQLTCGWTPCCLKVFHAHCLRRMRTCPLCRHQLSSAAPNRGGDAAPAGDLELAMTLADESGGGGTASSDRPGMPSARATALREQALELAFSGEWFRDSGADGDVDSSRWTNWFDGRGA